MRTWIWIVAAAGAAWGLDLREARIIDGGNRVAAQVLAEEVKRRTGLDWNQGAVEVRLKTDAALGSEQYALRVGPSSIELSAQATRGLLYAIGALLKRLDYAPGQASLPDGWSENSQPEYPLRGHQLGYRATANSWDAWTVAQFDQYIRDLVLQGTNAIENIPFQDTKAAPLMKLSRREMHRAMSGIAAKYGIEYWVWVPADFDLAEADKRAQFLQQFEQMVAGSARLDGIFVPGGDPGHNPPELVMPLLEDLARRTKAKIWLSLQGFNREREDSVYRWIAEKKPLWLGGLVAGPSSPPVERTRLALDRRYGLRLYPDITHNKICQHQVPHWDQAFALTLGREAINPRPAEMRLIHNRWAPWSTGFLSYSDGVHDDLNKAVFTSLAWDSRRQPRDIVIDYARLFFSSTNATSIADAILALEGNWRGPLVTNGNVEGTLETWDRLAREMPELSRNWRWQMNQLRAVYDAYVRRRLLHERQLEAEANAALLAPDPKQAIARARRTLDRWPVALELRARIEQLCEALFQSIGLQTSVEKYDASGAERGAVLDFINVPLNNRWWIEDELKKVEALADPHAQLARLREIALSEQPGPGSFYDDIGHEEKSPRVDMGDEDEPLFWWLDQGRSRLRLSAQTTMWPRRVVYEGLDSSGRYEVKTGGQGQSLLRINGARVEGRKQGEFHVFTVPVEALRGGRIELRWDVPQDESHLNWRQRSRLAEVWLLKRD
ncbi:MAG: glycoside hydrolase family 20 zincin-like fold domain-containing protein [Acidobacteriota bacterium]